MSGSASGATSRTESSFATLPVRRRDGKDRSTCFTDHLNGPSGTATAHDGQFAGLQSSAFVIGASMRIAGITRWDEVLRSIIRAIPIQMVSKERTINRMASRHPVDGRSAPMTSMRSAPDLFVEHDPGNRYIPTGWRKWMIREVAHVLLAAARGSRDPILSPPPDLVASRRAIFPNRAVSDVEDPAAVLAV